jgi:polysaccharide pyruvyl transferase WcaK-like protein
VGDGALVRGIQATLPIDTETEIRFINHCITDFITHTKLRFDSSYVDWLNNNADLLLIGGGGFITATKNEIAGLDLFFDFNVFQGVKIPVVFYAIGHNLFYGEALEKASAVAQLIAKTRELGGLFSVRNDGSLERLQKDIGDVTGTADIWEIPDPGLFVPVKPTSHPHIKNDRINIILQIAGDKLGSRLTPEYPGRPAGVSTYLQQGLKSLISPKRQRKVLWRAIARVCDELSGRYPVNFILAPHIYSDLAVTGEFLAAARKLQQSPRLAAARLEVAGIFRGTRLAPEYFDLYRQADFVVGMRGHSMIVSVGLGTPCVGIISHPKVEGFLKDCCLEEYSTPVGNADIEDSLFDKLNSLIIDNSEWKSARGVALERMLQKRKLFHEEIRRLLH